jgi:hypothetical protein
MKSITPAGKSAILIGRKSSETVTLNISSEGELNFRPADNGFIPIGSYAEFRKIGVNLGGSYKQEADLDLMNIDWFRIGLPAEDASYWFTGVFDGGGKRISNLLVNPGNNYAGLFGASRGTIKNVCIASGSLSDDIYVGSVVSSNEGFVIACSNAANITGGNNGYAGGIVAINSGTITACYNTGTVSGGTSGGVVGSASGSNTISNNYTGTTAFTDNPPSTSIHLAWGTGTGGTNQYWKNYTGNAGKPQLWFE